jgi:cell division protein FtsA
MESEIVVGLDIGTTKIVAMVGRKNEYGKIEVLGYGKAPSIGVRGGIVANIDDTVNSIIQAVKEAEEKSGVEIKQVNVGIAGKHIKSLQHRGQITRENNDDEINREDLNRLIEDAFKIGINPGEEIIHVLPQEYIIDNERVSDKSPVGMSGNILAADFHIITGLVSAIKNINKCVQRAGLEATGLTLEPIASSASVLSEEEKEAGVCLVDIGGGTTDIAIFQEGIIRHTAVIPLGANIITEDIKEACSIIKQHAEQLKIQFGSALVSDSLESKIVVIPGLRGREPKEISIKTLAQIIQARMEDIIKCIYTEIHNSGYQKKLIAGIVVTGGGSTLKHCGQLIEYLTGMDTKIGYPNEHLAKSDFDISSPIFATSIGLVIKAIEDLDDKKPKGKAASLKSSASKTHAGKNDVETLKAEKKVFGLFDKILQKSLNFLDEK